MVRKTFDSLRSVLSETAERKSEAARARSAGSVPVDEHSRDVFAAACAQIGHHFSGRGFRYAKSGPHLSRTRSGFKNLISMHTSRHNIPGSHVALQLSASVESTQLRNFRARQEHPYRADAWVAGGMVHLLSGDTYLEWELADQNQREAVITDVISFVELVVLPYFELFSDPTSLVQRLTREGVPEFSIASAVEFALCFGTRADAQTILARYLAEHPSLSVPASAALETFRSEGYPRHFCTIFAEQVAWVQLAYGLDRAQ